MKLKEFLEKYSKLVFRHIELDRDLSNIELEVGDLLNNYPGVGSEEYNEAEATYLTTETIVNALRELYEREGWRHPKWKEHADMWCPGCPVSSCYRKNLLSR